TITAPAIQQRREDGVRFGQMRKNAAIDAFNDELRQLRLEGVISTSIENALKFDKVDVNGDNIANIYDAKLVWLAQGKEVTSLEDQLSFTVTGSKLINSPVIVNGTQYQTTQMISLIAPELNDDGIIDQTDLDIALARVRGDTNLDGAFNNLDIAGFVQILTSPVSFAANLADIETSDLWLIGDFNGDGVVNNLDIAPFVAGLTGGRPGWGNDPSFAPLVGLVPEPGLIGLVALLLPGLVRRRRGDKNAETKPKAQAQVPQN
ncbi:MAG TPA: hypothetical protein PKB10_13025, partial [Tepidisphaeraceae bacterium]|nr:hypothetical protein [Tepidisphaeraceae bacterium]